MPFEGSPPTLHTGVVGCQPLAKGEDRGPESSPILTLSLPGIDQGEENGENQFVPIDLYFQLSGPLGLLPTPVFSEPSCSASPVLGTLQPPSTLSPAEVSQSQLLSLTTPNPEVQ